MNERHLNGEHGLTEATLLLAHMPRFEAPNAEVVVGLALIQNGGAFPDITREVRVKLRRIAGTWLNEQLSIAWQFNIPNKNDKHDETPVVD